MNVTSCSSDFASLPTVAAMSANSTSVDVDSSSAWSRVMPDVARGSRAATDSSWRASGAALSGMRKDLLKDLYRYETDGDDERDQQRDAEQGQQEQGDDQHPVLPSEPVVDGRATRHLQLARTRPFSPLVQVRQAAVAAHGRRLRTTRTSSMTTRAANSARITKNSGTVHVTVVPALAPSDLRFVASRYLPRDVQPPNYLVRPGGATPARRAARRF